MCQFYIFQRSSAVTKAMGSVMEDLTNTTYSIFKTYTSSHTAESVLLFVCSVARWDMFLCFTLMQLKYPSLKQSTREFVS
jgi:hypothetical protein